MLSNTLVGNFYFAYFTNRNPVHVYKYICVRQTLKNIALSFSFWSQTTVSAECLQSTDVDAAPSKPAACVCQPCCVRLLRCHGCHCASLHQNIWVCRLAFVCCPIIAIVANIYHIHAYQLIVASLLYSHNIELLNHACIFCVLPTVQFSQPPTFPPNIPPYHHNGSTVFFWKYSE